MLLIARSVEDPDPDPDPDPVPLKKEKQNFVQWSKKHGRRREIMFVKFFAQVSVKPRRIRLGIKCGR